MEVDTNNNNGMEHKSHHAALYIDAYTQSKEVCGVKPHTSFNVSIIRYSLIILMPLLSLP